MSFKDEVLSSKTKPEPIKTEMDWALECSQKIKEDIIAEAKRTCGHFHYFAVYELEGNYKNTLLKLGTITNELVESKLEYSIPKAAILFHDHLKSILAKDGIIVGDWEFSSSINRGENYRKIFSTPLEELGYIGKKRYRDNFAAPANTIEFNPNIPLEVHYKRGVMRTRYSLSQNGKIILEKMDGEATQHWKTFSTTLFVISFSE